jgi:hypothetical protein
MNRVIFLVDGFNFYHSLEEVGAFHKYKWIDYSKLAKLFVTKKDEIVDVFYFTAYHPIRQDKVNRHKIFIDALKMKGVNVIFGKFKMRDKECFFVERGIKLLKKSKPM